ncbi:carbon-monoxide dehydrogenase medium subunit [Bradyrhizobium algeriense]|uniref:Carbon-monoxide dehydrogenase medium subunit n=1 Tax=Bradyrhizobium algeriense TaxID=634784 RepID=A0ABU8BHJ8_9BRAD
MKPAPFAYHRPASMPEAIALLARLGDAKLLAGGQSLVPMLNMRFISPDHLIDISRIEQLAFHELTDDALHIGAMTRQAELLASPLVRRHCPLLAEALVHVGHQQTRSRGTIGGSLCHLDPAAEIPLVALALDATLTVVGAKGERKVPMNDWPAGYMMPELAADEILTAIRMPNVQPDEGHAFIEFARRRGDFAIVAVAAVLRIGQDGRISSAAIALGGMGGAAFRLRDAEHFLVGELPRLSEIRRAAHAVAHVDVSDDAYYTGAYRRHLGEVLVERALLRAAERAGSGGRDV